MYMDYTCTWTIHVHGPYVYMDNTCTWTIHVHVLYMYMDYTCTCVTLHGIYMVSRGNYFIIGVSYAPLGHLRMWRVQLS